MILVGNFKITNKRFSINLPRGRLKSDTDRMLVTKYTLASYVPFVPLLSKIILYIDLQTTEYAGSEKDLEYYIKSIFPSDKLIIRWFRNNTFLDWRKSCEQDIFPIDDDIIMNMTNDDHVFLDNNLKTLSASLENLKNCPDPYANLIYSHWPELIRLGANNNWSKSPDEFTISGNFRSVESFDILKKERWRHYWFDHDGPIIRWPFFRPESLTDNGFHVLPNGSHTLVPTKEMFRHFDGYNHAYDVMNLAPPLEIPPGFFEKQIKIRYGYDSPKEDWVHINPSVPNYKSVDLDGVDYKFALEDIPLFWRDKIIEIDINPNCNLEILKKLRDENFYNLASAWASGGAMLSVVTNRYPYEFFNKHYLSN